MTTESSTTFNIAFKRAQNGQLGKLSQNDVYAGEKLSLFLNNLTAAMEKADFDIHVRTSSIEPYKAHITVKKNGCALSFNAVGSNSMGSFKGDSGVKIKLERAYAPLTEWAHRSKIWWDDKEVKPYVLEAAGIYIADKLARFGKQAPVI